MTPYFFSYDLQDDPTPYLPASAGRRKQAPAGLLPTLAPPYHPNMFLNMLYLFFPPSSVTPTGLYLMLWLHQS